MKPVMDGAATGAAVLRADGKQEEGDVEDAEYEGDSIDGQVAEQAAAIRAGCLIHERPEEIRPSRVALPTKCTT